MKGKGNVLKHLVLIWVIIGLLVFARNLSTQEKTSGTLSDETYPGYVSELYEVPITGLPCNGTVRTYLADPKHFSHAEIDAFLAANGDSIISAQEEAITYYNVYSGYCYSGAKFMSQKSADNHPFSVFQYKNSEKCLYFDAYPIYYGEENYQTNSQYTIGWMFEEEKDFSFASAYQAEHTVREALACLGLSEVTLIRTLYLDHTIMEEAGKLLSTAERYAPIGESVPNNGFPIKEDWSESDDGYMFSFAISVQGTPLSYRSFPTDTSVYCGCEIIVWFTKDGIVFLTVTTPWVVDASSSTDMNVVSPQSAIETTKKKLENVLTYQDFEIESVYLEYQYIQVQNTWKLTPVWVVTFSYDVLHMDSRSYGTVYFDALSGEEK